MSADSSSPTSPTPTAEPPETCGYCGEPIVDEEDHGDDDELGYEHLHFRCLAKVCDEADRADNANVEAQEKACSALWDFAHALGITDSDKIVRAVSPALKRIVEGYGFNVRQIQ